MDNEVIIKRLQNATSGYSDNLLKAALAQSTLNKEQIRAILSQNGLQGELLETTTAELAQVASTNALTKSQDAATLATTNLTNAFKGVGTKVKGAGSALLGIAKAHPIITAIVAVVSAATFAFIKHKEAIKKAKESISELQSEYESGKSELESLNSSLEETVNKIDDLQSKGKLSLTEKSDLSELQKQNAELERKIDLQEKLNKQTATQTVSEIINNSDDFNSEFDENLKKYVNEKTIFEDQKTSGMNLLEKGEITKDIYNDVIAQGEEDLNEFYGNLLSSIEMYEKNKQSILDKYSGDITAMSEVDKSYFNEITSRLQEAYKAIYNDKEYFELVLTPIFNTDELDGAYESLIKYFSQGGSIDVSAIEKEFGSEFITALENACYSAGIQLPDLLNSVFDSIGEVNIAKIINTDKLSLDSVTSQVSSFTTAQEALTSALAEQNETGTISSETMATLKENYEGIENALEMTTSGIILNSEKLAELTSEEKKNIETDLASKEAALTEEFNKSSLELATYRNILENTTSTDEEYIASLKNLISQKESDVNATEAQIGELQALQLEYEQATSKHNKFMQALSSKDSGSMYDDVTSSLEQVQSEWDAGNFGKDEIRGFVDYMNYNDMSTASIDEIKNAYAEAMEMAQKYFTESSEGSQNFLELLEEHKLATNTDGMWDINIDDLDKAAQAVGFSTDFMQDQLNKLKDKGFDIEFETSNDELFDTASILEELDTKIANIKGTLAHSDQIKNLSDDDIAKLKKDLEDLENQRIEIKTEIDTSNVENAINTILSLQAKIDAGGIPSAAQSAMQQAQQQIANNNGLNLSTVLGIDTDDATARVKLLEDTVNNLDLKSTVTIDANKSAFDRVVSEIRSSSITADVELKVKGDSIITFINNVKSAFASKSGESSSDTGITPKWTGTAHAFGSAYKNGSWSVRGTGKSLVGELGMETLVRDGKYYTIGDNGAEFVDVKKDDIIFNHKQTEQLFKFGRINSRGKAFAEGNAYVTNTDVAGKGTLEGGKSKSKTNTGNNKGDSSTNKDKERSKQLIDWIARRLDVLQTKAERWAKIVENATNAKKITKYYNKLEAIYKKQIKTTFDGASRYLSKANSIKISKDKKKDADLKAKVRSKDSSLFTKDGNLKNYKKLIKEYGQETYDAIMEYQEWYDKYQGCIDSYIEACENLYNAPLEEAGAKIELLADKLELLDAQLDNVSVVNYKNANSLLSNQYSNQQSQESTNKSAYDTANKNLSSAKKPLDSEKDLKKFSDLTKKERKAILKAVEAGQEIDITLFKEGSKGYKKALAYNSALQARNDAQQEYLLSVEETKSVLRDTENQKFDNIKTYYKNQIELLDESKAKIQAQVDLLETNGITAGANYYKAQIEYEKETRTQLKAKQEELQAQLDAMEANGLRGTQEWYDAVMALSEVDSAITECDKSIAVMNNSITEVGMTIQNKILDRLSDVKDEMNFVVGLLSEAEMFDDLGGITDEGLATLGSYISNMNTSKYAADLSGGLVAEMQKALDENKLSFTYNGQLFEYNSREQLEDALLSANKTNQDQIKEYYDYQNKAINMVIEKLKAELSAWKDIIDAKKEALDHTKDLHDYTKSIQESTKNLASLEKQRQALQGDTSEEGMSRLQQLQSQIDSAKEDLEEKEYERAMSDQKEMLDDMMEQYESLLNAEMKDRDRLLRRAETVVKNKAADIESTIKDTMSKYDYHSVLGNIENGIMGLLGNNDTGLNGIKNAIVNSVSTEGTIPTAINGISTSITNGVNTIIETIKDVLMFSKAEPFDIDEMPKSEITKVDETILSTLPGLLQTKPIAVDAFSNTKSSATTNTSSTTKESTKSNNKTSSTNKSSSTTKTTKKSSDGDGKITIGEKVKFNSGKYTASSDGSGNSGKQNLGKDVYIQKINSGSKRPYLIGTSKNGGMLGWVAKKQLAGFSKGGLIEVEDLNKQIRANNDEALVSVQDGEGFLTKSQTDIFQQFVKDGLPVMNNMANSLRLNPRLLNNAQNPVHNNINAEYNFTLQNCNNASDIIRMFQTDKNVQNALQSVTIDKLNGGNRLSVNKYK